MNTGKRLADFQSYINSRKSLIDLNHLNRLTTTDTISVNSNKDYHDNVNSLGYRGPEFGESEILTLGCSQTWGTSLDEKYLWPSLIHNKVKKTYNNLAVPGDSVQSQTIKAFNYFKEYGNPKLIIGIFPFARLEFPYISDTMVFSPLQPIPYVDKNNKSHLGLDPNTIVHIADMYFDYNLNETKNKKSFTKTPHNLKEIFTVELALYYNNIFISILEQYCKSHGIDFIWSFWEAIDPVLDNLLKEKYSGYFSFPLDIHNKMINSNDLKDEYFVSLFDKHVEGDFFMMAPDGRHFGIGKHIFIADSIYNKMQNGNKNG